MCPLVDKDAKVVGLLPLYFPPELLLAAGARVKRLHGSAIPISRAAGPLPSFACSLARSVLEQILSGELDELDALFLPAPCDTLRALSEISRTLHPSLKIIDFAIPQSSAFEARRTFLEKELQQAGAALAEITGQEWTAESVKAAAAHMGAVREKLIGIDQLRRTHNIGASDYYACLKKADNLPMDDLEFLEGSHPACCGGGEGCCSTEHAGDGEAPPRVMLSGIVPNPTAILELLDQAGLHVVADDLAYGSRWLYRPGVAEATVEALEAYYFNGPPCSTLYGTAAERSTDLLKRVQEARAQGVIFWSLKFCEPEAFELPELLEKLTQAGIPHLNMEVELGSVQLGTLRTRLEAFAEILKEEL